MAVNMNEQNFIENSLIILTKQTLDKFLKQDNPGDLISLYTFYYYTAKWQGTNQPKCTTAYVANGLRWSENKVRKTKKQLIEFGLIEDIRVTDESGKIVGHYIKVNYIFKKETAEKRENNESHPNENAQGGNEHSMETRGTNALSTNKLNALSTNKERKKERKTTSYDEILSKIENDDLRELYYEFIKMRNLIKAPMTDRALKMLITEVNKLEPDNISKQKQILEKSILHNYKSVYPLNNKQNNSSTGKKENNSGNSISNNDGNNIQAERDEYGFLKNPGF